MAQTESAPRALLIEYRGKRSQQEMAELYGVTQQTWCCWELGRAVPRGPVMARIAQDAGASVEALFFN